MFLHGVMLTLGFLWEIVLGLVCSVWTPQSHTLAWWIYLHFPLKFLISTLECSLEYLYTETVVRAQNPFNSVSKLHLASNLLRIFCLTWICFFSPCSAWYLGLHGRYWECHRRLNKVTISTQAADALTHTTQESDVPRNVCKYSLPCFLFVFKVICCKKLSILFMLILYFPTGKPIPQMFWSPFKQTFKREEVESYF